MFLDRKFIFSGQISQATRRDHAKHNSIIRLRGLKSFFRGKNQKEKIVMKTRELSSCEAVRVKPVARKNPQAHFVVIIIVRIELYMYSMLRVKENDISFPFVVDALRIIFMRRKCGQRKVRKMMMKHFFPRWIIMKA